MARAMDPLRFLIRLRISVLRVEPNGIATNSPMTATSLGREFLGTLRADQALRPSPENEPMTVYMAHGGYDNICK